MQTCRCCRLLVGGGRLDVICAHEACGRGLAERATFLLRERHALANADVQ